MLKYKRDEREVRQQVTKRGKERKKEIFFSPKIIKSSKHDEEREKGKGIYLLKVETWDGQNARRKKKERKIKSKKKKREREKKIKKGDCFPNGKN